MEYQDIVARVLRYIQGVAEYTPAPECIILGQYELQAFMYFWKKLDHRVNEHCHPDRVFGFPLQVSDREQCMRARFPKGSIDSFFGSGGSFRYTNTGETVYFSAMDQTRMRGALITGYTTTTNASTITWTVSTGQTVPVGVELDLDEDLYMQRIEERSRQMREAAARRAADHEAYQERLRRYANQAGTVDTANAAQARYEQARYEYDQSLRRRQRGPLEAEGAGPLGRYLVPPEYTETARRAIGRWNSFSGVQNPISEADVQRAAELLGQRGLSRLPGGDGDEDGA